MAPALCIGIPSPEDTLPNTMDRMKDYFRMGLPTSSIVDPIGLSGWVATPGRFEEALETVVRAAEIEIPLTEVLA